MSKMEAFVFVVALRKAGDKYGEFFFDVFLFVLFLGFFFSSVNGWKSYGGGREALAFASILFIISHSSLDICPGSSGQYRCPLNCVCPADVIGLPQILQL
jgi:hypothetical protein